MIPQLGLAALWLAAALSLLQLAPVHWIRGSGQGEGSDPGRAVVQVQAGLLGISLVAMIVSFLQADFTLLNVASRTHSSRSAWERLQDAGGDEVMAVLCLLLVLALSGLLIGRAGAGLKSEVIVRSRRFQQVAALPFFALLIWASSFRRWPGPHQDGGGFGPFPVIPFFMPLLATGAALLFAAWAVHLANRIKGRRSIPGIRAARLFIASALVALGGSAVIEIARLPWLWLPLVEHSWNAFDWFVVLVWLAALVLAFRLRKPGFRQRLRQRGAESWGGLLLACGILAFFFGLIASSFGSHRLSAPLLCQGKTEEVSTWRTSLSVFRVTFQDIKPVVDKDFTGLEAGLKLRFPNGLTFNERPQSRDAFLGIGTGKTGQSRVDLWNGVLTIGFRGDREKTDCIDTDFSWHPFAQWLAYGAWLASIGALLMFAAAFRSAWWRAGAWRRIRDRQDDRAPRVAGGH